LPLFGNRFWQPRWDPAPEPQRSLDQAVLSKDHQQGKGILLVLFLVACLLVTVKASQHWAISLGRRESTLPKTDL